MIYLKHLLTCLGAYKVRATQALLRLFKCIRLGRHTQKATRRTPCLHTFIERTTQRRFTYYTPWPPVGSACCSQDTHGLVWRGGVSASAWWYCGFSAHFGAGGGSDSGGSAGDFVRRHQSWRRLIDSFPRVRKEKTRGKR